MSRCCVRRKYLRSGKVAACHSRADMREPRPCLSSHWHHCLHLPASREAIGWAEICKWPNVITPRALRVVPAPGAEVRCRLGSTECRRPPLASWAEARPRHMSHGRRECGLGRPLFGADGAVPPLVPRPQNLLSGSACLADPNMPSAV